MARINKTRYALLGILSMGKASGYDIKTAMKESTDHFWKEGDSSIYPVLKQLLDEGLVSVELGNIETDKPKKIYAITKAGAAALCDWLRNEPEPAPKRNELLLKVFFGWNADPEITINHLKEFRRKTEQMLNKYRSSILAKKASVAKLTNVETHRFLTLKAGIAYHQASLKWCDDAISLLNEINLKKKRRRNEERSKCQ